VDIAVAAGHGGFVFAAHPAKAAEPTAGAFDDPPMGEDHAPRHVVAAFDDLQIPAEFAACRLDELPGVAAIGLDFFQTRLASCGSEHELRSIAILHAGCGDRNGDQQAERVDQGVSLAAFDLLPRVVAALATRLGRLRRLAVEEGR